MLNTEKIPQYKIKIDTSNGHSPMLIVSGGAVNIEIWLPIPTDEIKLDELAISEPKKFFSSIIGILDSMDNSKVLSHDDLDNYMELYYEGDKPELLIYHFDKALEENIHYKMEVQNKVAPEFADILFEKAVS